MKNLKSILLVISVMAACVSFTSCEDDNVTPACVGSWEFKSTAGVTYTYIIKDDGTYIYSNSTSSEIGIYEYTEPSIIFVGATGDGIGTLSGRAMDIDAYSTPAGSGIYIKK